MCNDMSKKFTYFNFKIVLKNANPLSFQQVVITGHRNRYNSNNKEKIGNIARITRM